MTVGVDVQEVAGIDAANDVFVQRNFNPTEQAYAKGSPAPQASLAARWCAKEAVFKSLGVASQGGGAPMREIEIVQGATGTKPTVKVQCQLNAFRFPFFLSCSLPLPSLCVSGFGPFG